MLVYQRVYGFLKSHKRTICICIYFFKEWVATISVGYLLGCQPFPFLWVYSWRYKGCTRYYKTNCGWLRCSNDPQKRPGLTFHETLVVWYRNSYYGLLYSPYSLSNEGFFIAQMVKILLRRGVAQRGMWIFGILEPWQNDSCFGQKDRFGFGGLIETDVMDNVMNK